jgi:hypothetical protein
MPGLVPGIQPFTASTSLRIAAPRQGRNSSLVIAGLVPAIHDFMVVDELKDVDARSRAGHDGVSGYSPEGPARTIFIGCGEAAEWPNICERGLLRW